MNSIRILAFQLIRLYSSKPASGTAGIRGRLRLEKISQLPDDTEETNVEDLDAYTSDFMDVGKSHTMHQRELQMSKEKLKQRIVKRKYFKEVEPKFLTFMEKDQIRKLHQSDPMEWTPEKLSMSFPALPETIRSVLKAKWIPKSLDSIIKYDTGVVKNWKNFKTGKLVVNPVLREHLMKFKDRKIAIPDREVLKEMFGSLKMEFPKPKSSTFSSILKDVNEKQSEISNNQKQSEIHFHNQKLISTKNEINKSEQTLYPKEKNDAEKSITWVNNSDCTKTDKPKSIAVKKILTFDEFIKVQLKQLYNTSPEESITLLQTYRKYVESTNLEDAKSNKSSSFVEQENKENVVPTKNVPTVKENEIQTEVANIVNTERSNSIDTYVKEWKTDIDTEFEYVKPIKIPKNVWKHGMTYRVKDCYYDADGAFLYRVPGLKS
nr:uncharacterized protein LOC117229755 [Megalopta genalis]